jgi:hypothetical protein
MQGPAPDLLSAAPLSIHTNYVVVDDKKSVTLSTRSKAFSFTNPKKLTETNLDLFKASLADVNSVYQGGFESISSVNSRVIQERLKKYTELLLKGNHNRDSSHSATLTTAG